MLPTQSILCLKIGNNINTWKNMYKFPKMLSKYASKNKKSTLMNSISFNMILTTSQSVKNICLDYNYYFKYILINIIKLCETNSTNKTYITEVINYLFKYNLKKEVFMEIMKDIQLKINNNDIYDNISSKTKALFTREYNKLLKKVK